MSTAVLRYSAAALTDRGRKRTSNEDAFGYSVEHGAYVVCDGMGGAAAGEIASSLAVDEFLRIVSERRESSTECSTTDWASTLPQPGILAAISAETLIAEAVDSANDAIHSRAKRNLRLSGMGTTLVGLLIEEHRVLVLNVGDSRCYCLHAGRLRQVTEDHSLVEQQVRLGRMTPAEAARSPFKNVITRAVGTQPDVRADIFSIEPHPGDLFLLCSDGLTRELSDARIEALLTATANLDEICKRLIQAANKAGGGDNITCLLLRAE